jgi:glycosyltransferase involved in cell wall biosynthesis
MRIVFFTETFIPKVDGIVTTLCQTARQLVRMGHEVLIFAPEGGITEYEGARVVGVQGRALPFYPELRLSLPRASMRQILQAFRPDVIHVAEPILLGVAGLYYAGGRDGGPLKTPLVISYHTDLPKYLHYYRMAFLEPYIWPLLRLRHNRATLNLCPSNVMVQQLREHGIALSELWPGGVDTERFVPEKRSAAMRARLTDGHPESPLLLYAGRLSAEKEIERLKAVLAAAPDARLALVGGGPHEKALRGFFAGLPVHFAGFLHGDELAAAFASCDVFVMPSRTETLGLVVLEAMASGVPVVGARAGGIPEMVDDGVNGFLFDTEEQAAEQVTLLLGDAGRRAVMGEAAMARAAQHSWRAATEQLLAHYQTAIASQYVGPSLAPQPRGVKARTKQAMSRATLFAIRKLLP